MEVIEENMDSYEESGWDSLPKSLKDSNSVFEMINSESKLKEKIIQTH